MWASTSSGAHWSIGGKGRAHDLHVADDPYSPRDACMAFPRAAAAPRSSVN